MIVLDSWKIGTRTIELGLCPGCVDYRYWVEVRDFGTIVSTEPFDTEAKARELAERILRGALLSV